VFNPVQSGWQQHAVVATLRTLFPQSCAVAAESLVHLTDSLPEVEALAVKDAVPQRKVEFAAGRCAARQALAQAGFPGATIPAAQDRSPIWPRGTVGSIAHAAGIAVAVAAPAGAISALGVDIESNAAVAPELWSLTLTPQERAMVSRFPKPFRDELATAVLSIKEAFYKMQFPRTHKWLDLLDVEVELIPPISCWRLTSKQPIALGGKGRHNFAGTYRVGRHVTLAAAWEPIEIQP
jgi:4'-phosphopantetheinyl transferase EntD